MAYSKQNKGYLGYCIGGGLCTGFGGGGTAIGIFWYLLWNALGDMASEPDPVSFIFKMVGLGFIIGGATALVVGLALLGKGLPMKKAYNEALASSNKGYSYTPSLAYGTISTPVATAASVVMRCHSCGEALPEGTESLFCPNCGAPTR